ncbi:MAG: MFS transporter [Desulfonatronovibrionaceae bacterium]
MIPSFIRTNPRLAWYAFLAIAASGFGQTFFVSVMGEELRHAFSLSHAAYGSLYSGATVLSAVFLFRLGGLADKWPLPRVTTLAVFALGAGCLCIALAPSGIFLVPGFFLIRFGGQGYMGHLGITTAARYFPSHRGSAVAMAAFGFPLAEAVLPAGAALFIAGMGLEIGLTALLAGTAVVVLGASFLAGMAAFGRMQRPPAK